MNTKSKTTKTKYNSFQNSLYMNSCKHSLQRKKGASDISHRLFSCQFYDEVVVFNGGTIVQQGSHASLLSDKLGKHAELWNAQAQ